MITITGYSEVGITWITNFDYYTNTQIKIYYYPYVTITF